MSSQNKGCLFALFRLFGFGGKTSQSLPYRVRDDFLSPAEASFFRVLVHACGEQYRVFPKVRLSDVLFVKKGSDDYVKFRNKINQRHLDFLLCDSKTLRPAIGLELDDSSHNRPERKNSDDFLNRAFGSAGMTLVRIPVAKAYSVQDIRSKLQLNQSPVSSTNEKTLETKVPLCAKCGVPMVRKQGGTTGKPFYGCVNFPNCRENLPI